MTYPTNEMIEAGKKALIDYCVSSLSNREILCQVYLAMEKVKP